MSESLFMGLTWVDVGATLWLLSCWMGYATFARHRAQRTFCIASTLHTYRHQWMQAMLQRENRIADASLLSNLERNASFLASTSILVIAGLVTTLASIERVHSMLGAMPLSQSYLSPMQLQFKIMLLLMIYIYAFFTFTWSMRQYGFCAVLVGAAPPQEQAALQPEQSARYARYSAKIIDRAGHTYNYGLRAYYFSLSILAWMLNVWLFVWAVAIVVWVLYRREFHSKTLEALIKVGALDQKS